MGETEEGEPPLRCATHPSFDFHDADLTIRINAGPTGTEPSYPANATDFRVHRRRLSASPVFDDMFQFADEITDNDVIVIDEGQAEAWAVILSSIYNIPEEGVCNVNFQTLISTWRLADKYQLVTLSQLCSARIGEKVANPGTELGQILQAYDMAHRMGNHSLQGICEAACRDSSAPLSARRSAIERMPSGEAKSRLVSPMPRTNIGD